ncbi:MAG: VOC family protein [Actinomycetales bacterium]|nr:VOC family protein [Actinomycetales bacterium]
MAVKALDHIAVTVSDTQRALDFYCGMLGLVQVEQHQLAAADVKKANDIDNARGQSTRLAAPGTPHILIDLIEFFDLPKESAAPRAGVVGATHFALSVDDIWQSYEELRAKGVVFDAQPATFPLETGAVTVVFLSDPDGNSIELTEEHGH